MKKIVKEETEPPAVMKLISMIFAYRTAIGRLKVRQMKYGKI